MSSKSLCQIVRTAVIAVTICGLITCGYILPAIGADIIQSNPEFTHWYLPWLIFLLITSMPCFVILALVWKVSSAIKQERVFTFQTARLVKIAAMIMFCDVIFFFAGNFVLFLLNMNHPGIFFLSFFVDVFGIALALSAAILSRYLTKAAVLQEEADGTI